MAGKERRKALAVGDALTKHKVKHLFSGGLVASFYGEPRLTQDVDIIVEISAEQLKQLR